VFIRHTQADRMATHRKSDRRRDDLCAVALRKRAALSLVGWFSQPLRAAVLNVWPLDVVFMKENIVESPHIDHFSALLALVKVHFLRVT
jgi:hypothetical protein